MRHFLIHNSSRRQFVKSLSLAAIVPALPLGVLNFEGCSKAAQRPPQTQKPSYPSTLSGGAPCGSCIAPPELSWKTAISSKEEPGEPLDISGTIYQADGLTPAGDFVLFVYHTDATGYYNKDDDASHPRLHGWMHVGADGRYEFRTIKPAPYPHRTTPAHIHAHVYGPGYSERSIADYWFAGDRFITEEAREKAVHDGDDAPVVVALERDPEGVLRGVRDIRLRPTRS